MGADENRQTALRFYDAFNQRDFDTLAEGIASNFVTDSVPEQLGLGQGREAVLQFLRMNATAFPDLHFEVLDSVAEGDLVATRVRGTGTQEGEFLGIPASGNAVEVMWCDFVRFDGDGKVAEHWRFVDNLAFMQQLGAIPADMTD
jgi:steroid delta-isomerase-like uncharacterized protein